MHSLIFKELTENDVIFECEKCGSVIGFNKEGIGEPCAKLINGAWVYPENPDQWMGGCNAAV